ncbi:MAG: YceI family protein [Candidatus Sericytochromatia bacterium]|uniref:YceI family protein n=1 Tax=Candidatus Tanganyikabacteria bacterium TaxID=2961651 RepID=A0A937X712_9BACT|nr:YceI family protein [Candidatus Tanganyikabacteria bacterium]
MRKPLILSLLPLAAAMLAFPVQAATFQIAEDEHSLNEVTFTSIAPLVRMIGRTRDIEGKADLDPARPQAATGRFVVNLAALDTGIKLRNKHMLSTLDVEKYPVAILQIDKIETAAKELKPNQTVGVMAAGSFTIRGVTRPITVPGQVTFLTTAPGTRDADWVRLETRFPIKLADYQIPVSRAILGIKVADEVTIEVTAMAKASGTAQANPPAKSSSAR